MGRTTGDLTKPLDRTVSAAEADVLRRLIWGNLRRAWRRALGGYLTFVAIFAGAGVLQWWLSDDHRWDQARAAQLMVAAIFGLIVAYQTRRLLALPGLESLPVHRGVSALHDGYARLFTPKGFRAENLFSWSYGLNPVDGVTLSPEYVWQLDVVRTRHGGPEQYFVLAAAPLRPATDEERAQAERYLWEIGVYQHND